MVASRPSRTLILRCSLGTIHAVVGENGAGKSSLMKIVAGVIRPDEGRIYLDENLVHFASPADAARHGIACIFQELSLLPDLSVSDNISIASPPRRFGLIDRRRQRAMRQGYFARDRLPGHPSIGTRQGSPSVAPTNGGDCQGISSATSSNYHG